MYPDGTAVITLAHSNQDGLFRNGAFTSVIDAGQAAPCWMTRAGKYVFTANTGSKTISRLIGTGNNVFVDSPVAASITTGGGPSDIDADEGVLGVIDHGAGQSHLSLFTYNRFGELTASGAPMNLGVANANGVAIMAPTDRDEYATSETGATGSESSHQQAQEGRHESDIRRDYRGSALRGFADGDAPGPEGIPRAGRRPRDVPERYGVLACGASTGRRRPRTVGTARSADGDRLSADSHVRVRFRSLHDLRVAGHDRRASRVLRQADGARQTARRRRG